MEQVNQQISSAHNWLARIAFIFFGIMLMTFFGIVYLANKQYETPPSLTPTPIIYTSPSPTPDLYTETNRNATANWKTYINNVYKFEIKYPPTWYVKEHNTNLKRLGEFSLLFGREQEPDKIAPLTHPWPGLAITISKTPISTNLLQKTGVKGFYKYESTLFQGIAANKSIKIGNDPIDPPDTTIIFNSLKYGWSIKYPNKDLLGNHENIFDQILSTFKFLNSQTDEISEIEKQQIDAWITKNNLNEYGDPKDTVYTGGTPLFDERTGQSKDKYEYILEKHPTRPWKISQ